MSIMCVLRNSVTQSQIPTRLLNLSSMIRVPMVPMHLERPFVFRKYGKFTCDNKRNYRASQNISKAGRMNLRQSGSKILKYGAGFLGVCVVTVIGAIEYWKRQYRKKGIEPVINRRYGWQHVCYYYGDWMLPKYAVNIIDDVMSFQAREDDVWLIGFPKSGTTWLQEVVYLVGNDADLDRVQSPIENRVPNLEFFLPGVKYIDNLPSPRYMKTHLPFSILPNDYHRKRPKTIYIARNPKDLVVSFHFMLNKFLLKSMFHFSFSLEEFCQLFVDDEVYYGPWWKHVKEGWERRNDDNVLYITYEDMNSDLPGAIRRIAGFLNKELSDGDVEKIVSHCSFDAMRKNNFVNKTWYKDRGLAHKNVHFMRKGKTGDWKNHLSKDIETKLDKMVATKLEPFGVSFKDTEK